MAGLAGSEDGSRYLGCPNGVAANVECRESRWKVDILLMGSAWVVTRKRFRRPRYCRRVSRKCR